jgi:hypothetical protein
MIIEWTSSNYYQHQRYYSIGDLIGNWSGSVIIIFHVSHYFKLIKRTTYFKLPKRITYFKLPKRITYWLLNR